MPTRQDNYSSIPMPISAQPPQDISSYTRFIHNHTKRQMEAFGAGSPEPSSRTSTETSTTLSNGVSPPGYRS
jgi:hypothetical protein